MSRSQIGVGVIGYGYWGPNLVRNFANNAGVRLVGVCDMSLPRLAGCSRLYPNVLTTTDFNELISNPWIDAIAIATPVKTHFDMALAALKAGKHVLVEKPLAQTAAQVLRLMEEATRRNRVIMVDHTFLFTPAVEKIRQLIQEDQLGQVYYYDGIRSSLGLFQSDVNVIWDLAVHDVSIVRYIMDAEPVAVSATATNHVDGSPENMAHLTLFFADNFVAHISVNWLSPVKVRQTFIGGSRKMVVYDDMEATEKVKVYDKGITVSPEKDLQLRIGYRAGDMWAPHLPAKEALETQVEHFVDCITNGVAPRSDGASGLRVVEILEAASQSIAARGNPVSLQKPLRLLVS
jgi:predicted dehydrogenase